MKKIFSTIFAVAVIVSMAVLTSCGGAPGNADVAKIIDKYDDGEKLTEKDYSNLIDYYDAAMDEALPFAEDMQKYVEKGDMENAGKIMEKVEKIENKYEHAGRVAYILSGLNKEDLGESNALKMKELTEKAIKVNGAFDSYYDE